ncbi:MAG: family 20 glycosylhydrolase [Pyrinomonadaceae bacterium]
MMKSLSIVVLFVAVVFSAAVFGQSGEINIIPKPRTIVPFEGGWYGYFTLSHKTKLYVTDNDGKNAAALLNDMLHTRYGFKLKTTNARPKNNYIIFSKPETKDETLAKPIEGSYALRIKPSDIHIFYESAQGYFYAIQSLLQLLPAEFSGRFEISAKWISDKPRFPYRGMHLDVARHFMPVEFVKKYIDLMSQYKFNYFHWHLTEDQGWRIEIKKYPRLTDIGSKRSESHEGVYSTIFKGDGRPVEGFYTQQQIRDVVAYARARYITVIPEIELPGHASAALAAYPEFGCKQDYKYEVKKTWGIFKEVFCPTDATFKFLEDVLDETIALFPDSPYIHIGGDEVLKDHWKESPFVQDLMKRENLKDEHEVQSYFVRRIEKHINKRGKKMIGWDEILEGGLAPNATVMSWRGTKGGIEAARSKHDVIMTPTDFCYLDYGQGDPAYEPLNIGGYLPLEKVYSFEPVPKELTADEARYIIGGQANVWSEYLETPSAVEYMAFPRMLALSEVLWSRKEDRDFADFQRRMNTALPRLDKQNVNYRIPEPAGLQNIVTENERVSINLTPAPATRVHYTVDGSTPDDRSTVYSKPIEMILKPGESKTLKTIVVNSSGRKSSVYAATIVRGKMLPAVEPSGKTPGVTYSLYVPSNAYAQDTVPITGETKSIGLQQFAQRVDPKKTFGVTFEGYVNVPTDEVYEFQIDSTWSRSLSVDGQQLIDEAGTKDRAVKSAIVPLKAGWHKLTVHYDHGEGDMFFRLRYGIKGQGLRQIGGGELIH